MIALLPYAIDRRILTVAITPPDGSRPTTHAELLPLWHEAEIAPGQPHPVADMWRVLYRDVSPGGVASFRPGHVIESEVAIVEVDPIAMPADIVTEARPGSLQRAELLCVCARFEVGVRFAYDKGQGIYEPRRGVPLGFKAGKDGLLLVLADADRDDAIRSFKLGAVSGILVTGTLPRWEPMVGWMRVPVATDPDADAAGVTADDVAGFVERRQS